MSRLYFAYFPNVGRPLREQVAPLPRGQQQWVAAEALAFALNAGHPASRRLCLCAPLRLDGSKHLALDNPPRI
jgi:hypothetical protein